MQQRAVLPLTSSGNPDPVNLITSAAWKYDTSGIDIDQNGKVDHIGDTTVTACQKDDIFTFHKDSTGVLDEGPTKCNAGDPQTQPFSWYFMNNDKVLNVTSNTILNGSLNIFSLTSSNMVIYKDTLFLGAPIRYVVQFSH